MAVATPSPAAAGGPWLYRPLTLPQGDVAVDFGMGYGHAPAPQQSGWGLNLELAAGVARDFEFGIRTGFRLDDGGQVTQADRYGRPFDTETYGTNFDRVANPELRFRWTMARGYSALLGLELRAYLPIENNSRFGFMFGLPIVLRAGPIRFDTGLYVPVIFTEPNTTTVVSIPLHIWIQVAYNVALGPLLGLQVWNQGGNDNRYPLGFGLGVGMARNVDLKTWFLFPDMGQESAARWWGVGVALQVRFE